MQCLVLLIVVADVNTGAEPDTTLIRFQTADDQFQKGGLSGPVVANHTDTFAAPDFKVQICKKRVLKAFFQVFDCQYIITGKDTGGQLEMHAGVSLGRLVDSLDFVQHLFAALRTLDGLFSVETFQLLDDGFLMPDFSLLIHPAFQLCLPELPFLLCVCRVVAGK